MSKVELVQKAVADALQRAAGLEQTEGLRSVTVVVKMNQATGKPRAVIVHTESEETL